MKRIISLILCLCLLAGNAVFAAPEPLTLNGVSVSVSETTKVSSQVIDSEVYLFLPPSADVTALPLCYEVSDPVAKLSVTGKLRATGVQNGENIDLTALCGDTAPYVLQIRAVSGSEEAILSVTLIPTDGIAGLYLRSEDPVNEGRVWVESSPTKSNSAKGSMLLVSEDGTTVYDGALTQIKGRGNSTWLANKKPYQIKLADKTDLLESGKEENVAKTWVLLTNHSDASLLRNELVYSLSMEMGMKPGIECRPVNLFYDGEYRGAYLLSEKVEINEGRVDIEDLEGSFEDSNPEVDFDSLSVETGKTANGATYVYCPDLVTPENFSGGYLLEMDTAVRAMAEKCYLITSRGNYIVVKSPEFCSKEAMDYIASFYQEFEDTVYNAGVHPGNGKTLADYASIDSLAQCYIVNELTKNPDGYRTSCYFYKDADSDTLVAGPIWDYDLSFGSGFGEFIPFCADPTDYFTLYADFSKALYRNGDFRAAVNQIYTQTVSPIVTNSLLPAIDAAATTHAKAAAANSLVWGFGKNHWKNGLAAVRSYVQTRNTWLTDAFASWNAEAMEPLNLYHDVKENAWYYYDVMEASNMGLMNGMGYAIFSPDGLSTRAQATKVLFQISGDTVTETTLQFPDVPDGVWYAAPVAWAVEKGVVKGYEDGTFCPDKNISRQELVVLMYRYLDEPKVETDALADFTDTDSIAPYAVDAMNWAISMGIVKGYEDNTLRPGQFVTRAELAALMVRYCQQYFSSTEN